MKNIISPEQAEVEIATALRVKEKKRFLLDLLLKAIIKLSSLIKIIA